MFTFMQLSCIVSICLLITSSCVVCYSHWLQIYLNNVEIAGESLDYKSCCLIFALVTGKL